MLDYRRRYEFKKTSIINNYNYWLKADRRVGSYIKHCASRDYSRKLDIIEYWESWGLKYVALLPIC